MKNKKILTALFLTAGLLTACSSDDEQAPINSVRHISVEVNQRPMTSDDLANARRMTTRSAITTTETLNAFSMRGIYDKNASEYNVSKSDNTWTVDPDTWPDEASDEAKVPFYAFTQGEFQWNNGSPYISFTIAENASTQHDLLVSKNNVAYGDHGGNVSLIFDHACAALEFNVQMTNTLSNTLAGKPLTVSSIVLSNVSNTGKYYFETSSWGDVSGSSYYTLSNSNMTITTTPQALSSNYLFVIPQNREANGTSGTYLDITYAFTGQTKSTATIPLPVNWEAGTQYTININLGTTTIQ